jgi:hypothetical protein
MDSNAYISPSGEIAKTGKEEKNCLTMALL